MAMVDDWSGGRAHHGVPSDNWAACFRDQKAHSYPQEDVLFWRTALGLKISPTSSDIIEALMNHRSPGQELYFYQDVVRQFCSNADMIALNNGDDTLVTRPLALLDDRNGDAPPDQRRGNIRTWKGGLTAPQLYQELLRRVGKTIFPRPVGQFFVFLSSLTLE